MKIYFMNNKYDLIIIWAWSAGYTAGIYAGRYRMKTLIIWWQPGWALATSHRVENYPWTFSASGAEIMNNFKEHVLQTRTEIIYDMVYEIKKQEKIFQIKTSLWKEFETKYVLIATGSTHKQLWVPWEKQYIWRWVSYCATCDWMFFKNKNVAVIWWWNTALTESLYLAWICRKVYIIHRNARFRCDSCWVEEAQKNEKIEILYTEEVEEIVWDDFWVNGIKLKSGRNLTVKWVFIAVWVIPNTQVIDWLEPEKDASWYLIVSSRQETSIKWIFAAWDITTASNKFMQAITSAAEWAIAVSCIQEDLLRWETSKEVIEEAKRTEIL